MTSATRAPHDVAQLSRKEYWDERYRDSDSHEWFKSFAALEPFFERHLFSACDKNSKILHLGSGDSTIPHDLAQHGYEDQTCVDFSPFIVQRMAKEEPRIRWLEADVRNLDMFPEGSIDVAFDKGTLDAMIHGSPWNPPEEVVQNTSLYIDEVYRTLKPDGIFLYITYRQPHFIKPLINRSNQWDLEFEVLQDGDSSFEYHAFILRKGRRP